MNKFYDDPRVLEKMGEKFIHHMNTLTSENKTEIGYDALLFV